MLLSGECALVPHSACGHITKCLGGSEREHVKHSLKSTLNVHLRRCLSSQILQMQCVKTKRFAVPSITTRKDRLHLLLLLLCTLSLRFLSLDRGYSVEQMFIVCHLFLQAWSTTDDPASLSHLLPVQPSAATVAAACLR